MKNEIGPQYSKDNGYKGKARLHQSKFRVDKLNEEYNEYGNRLCVDAGEKGKNFYRGYDIFRSVKTRYPKFNSRLYCDMLRSEHIPFNLFIPLRSNLDLAKSVFNELLDGIVKEIDKILIEYAPTPKSEFLDDNTSFDAYIEYKHIDNSTGIIGIEVKYTEEEYRYGEREKERMFDETSIYNTITEQNNIYKSKYLAKLKTKKYKQLWRNHLLGESIIEKSDNCYKHFTSLLFYPNDNGHFADACKSYKHFISDSDEIKFLGITYEQYFELLNNYSDHEDISEWINYLQTRYIIL